MKHQEDSRSLTLLLPFGQEKFKRPVYDLFPQVRASPGRRKYYGRHLYHSARAAEVLLGEAATPNRHTIIINHDFYIVMVRMAYVDVLKKTNQRWAMIMSSSL